MSTCKREGPYYQIANVSNALGVDGQKILAGVALALSDVGQRSSEPSHAIGAHSHSIEPSVELSNSRLTSPHNFA